MIYLDYAATTPINKEVYDSYVKLLGNYYANSSSLHKMGLKANEFLEASRESIASLINVKKEEIIFTSGATESNNLAILGILNSYKNKGKRIITSSIEHPSIMNLMESLELKGYEVIYLSVNEEGKINLDELKEALKTPTVLVSVMHVNNEVGCINNINEISNIVHKYDALFHSDITQSIGKIKVDLSNIDLASFSSHKLFAPKGSGVLVKKSNIKLTPLFYGGGQESNYRSGTSNWPTNVSMAKALRLCLNELDNTYNYVSKLWNKLYEGFKDESLIHINSNKNHSPYIFNFSIATLTSEVLVHSLEEKGFCVSTVSACGSKISKGSYVIRSMYNNDKYASSSVRVSLSKLVKENDIDLFIKSVKEIIRK